MIEGDTELKPFNAGRAAMDGVTAAMIGRSRFKAPQDALGGKRGFLKVMTDCPRKEFLNDFSSNKCLIETIYVKPYAACRHCHPSIEAALRLRGKVLPLLDKIDRIQVITYKLAVEGHDHTVVDGVNSAKMSIPYGLGVALVAGSAGLKEYTQEMIRQQAVLDIANKVQVIESDEMTALCPGKRCAELRIEVASNHLIERVDYPKGEPENPLTNEELYAKFTELVMWGGLSERDSEELLSGLSSGDLSVLSLLCSD